MRFSNFLLPIALLLTIGSAVDAPTDKLVGTWTNSEVLTDTNPYCCVPLSIKVTSQGSGYFATYQLSSSTSLASKKCNALFPTASSGTIAFTKKPGYIIYEADSYLYDQLFKFKLMGMDDKFAVYVDGRTAAEACYFEMKTRELPTVTPTPSSGSGSGNNTIIIILIIIIVILIGVLFKNNQSKQAAIITQQNLVNPTYGAGNTNPQMNYAAPGQFNAPNTQVNMNYPGNVNRF